MFMPAGNMVSTMFTDEFLLRHGAAPHSTIIMTPSGFLTSEAWVDIVPRLCKGLRAQVVKTAAKYGIDEATANKLLVALFFDGFGVHTKCLQQLQVFADANFLCACEDRDSSEINQVTCNQLINIIFHSL